MNRTRPNPDHHNYNRPQAPKTRFTSKINWFILQVMGAQSNLSHSGTTITHDPMFKELTPETQSAIADAINEARNVSVVLKDVAEKIKDLNGPNKWRNK